MPDRIPVLAPRHLLLASALREELAALTRAPNRLSPFPKTSFLDPPAHILVRYGVVSIEASKQTERQARGYLFGAFAVGGGWPSRK